MLSDVFKRINFLIWWILLPALVFLFSIHNVLAADIFCGHDDDESGAYDTACYTAAKDKDHDGFTTDGTAGHSGSTDIDCDDTNWKIGTDAWVDAGSGNVKRCKADGTYTTPVAVASLVASDISSTSTTLKFISSSGVSTGGCGAFGNPCDYRCLVDSGRACYVAPSTTNDAFWFLSGTYSAVATTTVSGEAEMMYLNGTDGSAAHPVRLIADPRAPVIFDTTGTSGSLVRLWRFDDVDYLYTYGFDIGHGYGQTGVTYNTGSNNKFLYGRIQDVDGNSSNNVSGITLNGGNNNEIRATLFKDIYDRAAATNENNAPVVIFSGTGNKTDFNSFINSSTKTYIALKHKHGQASSTGEFIGNYISNFITAGIGWNTTGTVTHNYVKHTNADETFVCFDQHDWGGTPYYDGKSIVAYNECVNGGFILSNPFDSVGAVASTYLEAYGNAVIDAATAYSFEDGVHHAVTRVGFYGDDTQCNDISTGGPAGGPKFNFHDNILYNSNSVALKFTRFGSTSPGGPSCGADYSSLSGWKSVGSRYDSGTAENNPACNADGSCSISTVGIFGDLSGTTTTTSVTTTTSSTTTTASTTTTTSGTTSTSIPGTGGAMSAIY